MKEGGAPVEDRNAPTTAFRVRLLVNPDGRAPSLE